MSKTVSNTTCVKCHNCGEYTNYADSVYHKEREAELAATKQRVEELETQLTNFEYQSQLNTATVNALESELSSKQAEIDGLMLEYCPEAMTVEQMAVWGVSQRNQTGETK